MGQVKRLPHQSDVEHAVSDERDALPGPEETEVAITEGAKQQYVHWEASSPTEALDSVTRAKEGEAMSFRKVLILSVALLTLLSSNSVVTAQTNDALHRKILGELDQFTAWLDQNNVRGFVGEIGWPDNADGDAAEWNELAEQWFQHADAADLSAMFWATGEWWGPDYKLWIYEDSDYPNSDGVDSANTQAQVLEAHPSSGTNYRGVVVATGTFWEADHDVERSKFSNHAKDFYGRKYIYDGQDTFDYLASRGIDLVKIEFRWELLQPKLGEPLDKTEIQRLTAAVDRARSAGLQVILSMHNFGAYFLWNGEEGVRRTVGTKKLPIKYLQNAWKRISARFDNLPDVYYAIMCEPVRMKTSGDETGAQLWERVSQKVVEAIRSVGDDKLIFVSGYQWSALDGWARRHPEPWISDPADNVIYEAHHYWDRDSSGSYDHSYAEEVAWAESEGF